ncbi:hypothetical protein MTR67_018744 [Solanum verrucosum]|uniref:Uncharacterized protein n=1 Tax=Solanum verrucosum TaxID=315347 RepID=A0AAF0TMY4_SOLVR|nr:hypothetical protein MTR67_018744 [Solanum verrucosum]
MNSSNFIVPMDYFESLLEGCKFEIISKPTPADTNFFLDKHNGKKYFMIAPRELIISDSDDAFSRQWVELPDSRFSNYESEANTENQANTLHLPRLQESGDIPKMRGDGWMEKKLGYFDSKKGTDGPVEARLFEMNRIYKGGLIVEGVEFRPK